MTPYDEIPNDIALFDENDIPVFDKHSLPTGIGLTAFDALKHLKTVLVEQARIAFTESTSATEDFNKLEDEADRWLEILSEFIGLSYASDKTGFIIYHPQEADVGFPDEDDITYEELVARAEQSLELMKKSGELAERENLWAEFYDPPFVSFCEGLSQEMQGLTVDDTRLIFIQEEMSIFLPVVGYWQKADAIAEQYRSIYYPTKLLPRTTPFPEHLHSNNDSINREATLAFSKRDWRKRGSFLIHERQRSRADSMDINLKFEVAVPQNMQGTWPFPGLDETHMIAGHKALWSRWYLSNSDGKPLKTTINQLCDNLGYKKMKNGGFRPDHKVLACNILNGLSSITLDGDYAPPNGSSRTTLSGNLWEITFDDTDSRYFHYKPGRYYYEPGWSAQNRFAAQMNRGYFYLKHDNDKWAIKIGAYLVEQDRINNYRGTTLAIKTILEGRVIDSLDTPRQTESEERFERAMARLVEVKLIASWQYQHPEPTETEDNATPDQLAAYYNQEPPPVFRDKKICCSSTYCNDSAAKIKEKNAKAKLNRKGEKAK